MVVVNTVTRAKVNQITKWTKDLTKKNFSPEKLKDPSRAWAALPEVFMWGEEQVKWFHPGREDSGEPFRVCLPDIVMHARATNGEMKRFDYTRHEVPPGKELAARDLKKQPALETVVCHLD